MDRREGSKKETSKQADVIERKRRKYRRRYKQKEIE